MSGDLTREEVSSRLEAIFSASIEGEELEKALGSIEKRLDKFEGKWAGLIKWAEQKYEPREEDPQGDSKDQEVPVSDSPVAVEDDAERADELEVGLTREEASSKLESIFRSSNLEGEELEKMIGSIDKRLDKFEGKWPKLILWAEEKYVSEETSSTVEEDSDSAPEKSNAEETLELIVAGDHESALIKVKSMISQSPEDSDSWIVASSYFSSIGLTGRAKFCEERAEQKS